MDKPLVIGIAGGTASGKTTIARSIADRFAPDVAVLYHDSYYKRQDHLTYDQRAAVNYDAPDAFDNDLLVEHVRALSRGEAIDVPVYSFSEYNRSDRTTRVEPSRVIVLEGILILAEPSLRNLCDVKIFVDTDADVRILRRIKRDVLDRGRSIDSVEHQYLTTVKPMHDLYVEPSKHYSDIIIPEGGKNLIALDLLFGRIAAELRPQG